MHLILLSEKNYSQRYEPSKLLILLPAILHPVGGVAKCDVIQGLWLTFTIDCYEKLVDDISSRLNFILCNFKPVVKVIDSAYKS